MTSAIFPRRFFRPVLFCLVLLLPVALLAALLPALAMAQQSPAPSGLPIPRFVSLRSGEVNIRTGPGVRYPIDWVFLRKDMPVEIVAEFDTWRRIRDAEGTEGWVHQSLLSGKRTIVFTAPLASLRREPRESAPLVAKAEPGVIGELQECRPAWCRVKAAGLTGWVQPIEVWGVYPDEWMR
ncbi:SH3 domain-containing protein [Oceanibaculum nanhaiense]|uniref:SH3 domain-containing protein n=1 Tax=Oceanibaculum nanhaiense TaxID=1909734 RepID=UPI001FE2F16E|nr:SH3 domain-containing protein [Oceanibaculum nanhaiense]